MQRHELIQRLAGTLSQEAAVLRELATAMKSERNAFVALRPSDLEEGLKRLAGAAQRACELAQQREQLLSGLAKSIGARMPMTLSTLEPYVPAELRTLLQSAADSAGEAARELQVESRVGGRMLQESRRWHRSLLGGAARDESAPQIYDARATARQLQARQGSLLRGTV